MTSDSIQVIEVVQFNPKIKTYNFFFTAFNFLLTLIGIPPLLFWFLGLGQYFTKPCYNGLTSQLMERHLEFKKGVFFKVNKTISLENIHDLTFVDNPILQWLDLRILKIETVGHCNTQ